MRRINLFIQQPRSKRIQFPLYNGIVDPQVSTCPFCSYTSRDTDGPGRVQYSLNTFVSAFAMSTADIRSMCRRSRIPSSFPS